MLGGVLERWKQSRNDDYGSGRKGLVWSGATIVLVAFAMRSRYVIYASFFITSAIGRHLFLSQGRAFRGGWFEPVAGGDREQQAIWRVYGWLYTGFAS